MEAGTECILCCFSPPTVVEVAEVACIEEEMRPEKVSEAALARPEGQWSVEVQAACPVRLPAQIVTWSTQREP